MTEATAATPAPIPHGEVDADLRPRMRGWIHLYAVVAAAIAGTVLIVVTACLRSIADTVAVTVYVVTICGVFGVSATYHRHLWRTARTRMWTKRGDHSMIFVFIAGTYTPFCVAGLPASTAAVVLTIVWVGAICGVLLKVCRPTSPRWLGVILYIALGWTIVAVAPELASRTGATVIVLLAAGGVLYSVGGVLFALRRPDPWPHTYGHHEVFHTATVIAALLHYIAVWLVVFG
ncbi:hemolysin III family protein [Gordonia jinhuaensis]|uniref:Hemolysin III n=1 Tax=Gordonia jinhuaensis TaxID=1517702 RepID=A0A916SU57_9ACTN|nr:hemolysin III family protein [Gordonia jinhuaensis]GGB17813.1 hypothetical protein GCM10011489_02380 [Gordonia jinhuaensis]